MQSSTVPAAVLEAALDEDTALDATLDDATLDDPEALEVVVDPLDAPPAPPEPDELLEKPLAAEDCVGSNWLKSCVQLAVSAEAKSARSETMVRARMADLELEKGSTAIVARLSSGLHVCARRRAPVAIAPVKSTLLIALVALSLAACGEPAQPKLPDDAVPSASAIAGPAAAPPAAAAASVTVPPAVRAVVDAPDRSDADRALDAGRHPAELLAFFGIAPGMKVAELGAGGGYTAELLARAVGPSGVVYGQNNKFIIERFAQKPWTERLAKPIMKNVVRVDREFDDPLPAEAHDLDAVFMVLFYHDTVWMETDRARMNSAVFKALKPGGVFAIIDHSGRPGTGTTETKTLHRIDEAVVKKELEAAGFKLGGEASFLRNPSDARDWNDAPSAAADKRGTSDRFVMRFVKP